MSLLSQIAAVLFVGHSLVGGQMPAMVEGGLRQMGADARVARQVINGAPLHFNWDHSDEAEGVDGRAYIAAEAPGAVVLTEAQPLAEHVEWSDPPAAVLRYHAAAVSANPEARIYLYETWPARAPGETAAWRAALDTDLALWEGIVAEANAGRAPGTSPVRLIPAGQAMARAHDEIAAGRVPGIDSIGALFNDDIHLNDRGAYLVAMVQIAALAGESPEGLPPRLSRRWAQRDVVVDAPLAGALQRIARETVQGYAPPDGDREAATGPPDAAGAAAPASGAAQRQDREAGGPHTAEADAATPPPADAPEPGAAPRDSGGATPAFDAGAYAPVRNPNLAIGLNGITDWSTQHPFIDVMKTARPWIGHLPGEWGGRDHGDLAAAGHLDPDGWPLAVPDALAGIATLVLTDLPETAVAQAGRYRLTHDGAGRLEIGGRARNVVQEPGEAWFDFSPGRGGVVLTIRETGGGPEGHIRNIRIVKQAHLEAEDEGALFNPDWLARIRGVRGVRFMDWMDTNDSTLSCWQDRPRVDDYTYARIGAPLPVMVALANELQADPWFTLPHLATDGYIRAFAEAVHATLDPGLRAHVELSNEVWNWQFAQARWAEELGQARWGRESAWVQAYAMRATQMAGIWTEVFGDDAPARLVRVIGVQTGWLGLEDDILHAPLWQAEDPPGPAPYTRFDAYAVTGYFGGWLAGQDHSRVLRRWLRASRVAAVARADAEGLSGDARTAFMARHRFDAAVARAVVALRGEETARNDTLVHTLGTVLRHHAQVAEEHGLQLVMYEGGTHVVATTGPLRDDAEVTAFLHQLNYSEGMAGLYRDLMAGWATLTEAPFNAFVDVVAPTKWGSWGGLRHLADRNSRWTALTAPR